MVGGVPIENLEAAVEQLGRRRRKSVGMEQAVLPFIIATNGPMVSDAMCAEAEVAGCTCDYTYSTVMVGLAVSCTIVQLEPLLRSMSTPPTSSQAPPGGSYARRGLVLDRFLCHPLPMPSPRSIIKRSPLPSCPLRSAEGRASLASGCSSAKSCCWVVIDAGVAPPRKRYPPGHT
jgi:hypothetical protein